MPQLVDPFVPVSSIGSVTNRASRQPLPSLQKTPAGLQQKPRLQLLTDRQRPTTARPQTQPQAHIQANTLRRQPRPYQSVLPPKESWLNRHKRTQKMLTMLQFPAVLIGSLAAGVVAQSVVVGQVILLIYAIIALVFRIESKTTFLMAFLLFCALAALLIFRSNNAIATNFAVYAFILLLVGVLSLLRELKERYV